MPAMLPIWAAFMPECQEMIKTTTLQGGVVGDEGLGFCGIVGLRMTKAERTTNPRPGSMQVERAERGGEDGKG